MDESRYTPPTAQVTDLHVPRLIPGSVLKKIRNAWVACLVLAAIKIVFVLVKVSGNRGGAYLTDMLEVLFILGMAFGIDRKSRVCA